MQTRYLAGTLLERKGWRLVIFKRNITQKIFAIITEHNLPLLVGIGLNELPNSRGGEAQIWLTDLSKSGGCPPPPLLILFSPQNIFQKGYFQYFLEKSFITQ